MKVVFENGKPLSAFFSLAQKFCNEGSLVFSEQGFSFAALDESQIALLKCSLDRKKFKQWTLEKTETVGLDLDEAKSVFPKLDGSEVSLSLEEDKLIAKIRGELEQTLSIPTIEMEAMELPTPKIDFEGFVEINPKPVLAALKELAKVSASCYLQVSDGIFLLKAKGGKGKKVFSFPKDRKTVNLVEGEAIALFSIEYLEKLLGQAKTDFVYFSLKTDYPLKIAFDLHGMEVFFYLAMRLEGAVGESVNQMEKIKPMKAEPEPKPKPEPKPNSKKKPVKTEPLTPSQKSKTEPKNEKVLVDIPEGLKAWVEKTASKEKKTVEGVILQALENEKSMDEADPESVSEDEAE